jgi:hypothetical protein
MTYATKITNIKAIEYIQNRINFDASNLHGYLISSSPDCFSPATGRLPSDVVSQLQLDEPDYIVYSYGTPIAWHGKFGWSLPAIKYSQTTSRHQSIVRSAIA